MINLILTIPKIPQLLCDKPNAINHPQYMFMKLCAPTSLLGFNPQKSWDLVGTLVKPSKNRGIELSKFRDSLVYTNIYK